MHMHTHSLNKVPEEEKEEEEEEGGKEGGGWRIRSAADDKQGDC